MMPAMWPAVNIRHIRPGRGRPCRSAQSQSIAAFAPMGRGMRHGLRCVRGMQIASIGDRPSNLTIALIERDRTNPAPAACCSQRAMPATRVALLRQAQFAPEPLLSGACYGTPSWSLERRDACQPGQRIDCTDEAADRDRERPYDPHRMPVCHLPYDRQKLDAIATDPFDRLLDVYG